MSQTILEKIIRGLKMTEYKTIDYTEKFLKTAKNLGAFNYFTKLLDITNFHDVSEDSDMPMFTISETRAVMPSQDDLHDDTLAIAKESAILTAMYSVLLGITQGNPDVNPNEPKGLTTLLNVKNEPNISAIKDKVDLNSHERVHFTNKDNSLVYIAISKNDDFSGLNVYGNVKFTELSDNRFNITWKGYYLVNQDFLDNVDLYSYPSIQMNSRGKL